MGTKSKSISCLLLWKLAACAVLLIALIRLAMYYYLRYQTLFRSRVVSPDLSLLVNSSVPLSAAALFYLILTAGQSRIGGPVRLYWPDRLYADLHTLLAIAATFYLCKMIGGSFGSYPNNYIFLFMMFAVDLNYVLSMARQIKNRSLSQNLFYPKAAGKCRAFLKLKHDKKLFALEVIALVLLYSLAATAFFAFYLRLPAIDVGGVRNSAVILAFLVVTALVFFKLHQWISSFFDALNAMREMSRGNLDIPIRKASASPLVSILLEEVKNVQLGLKNAVAQATRSEKMKTELLTNVTHDLKTPLTSILNYADLLQKEGALSPKAEEYIAILSEKSGRLKMLVEDLIEASKAASGNLEVHMETLDLNEFVRQTLGEYGDRFSAAKLDVRAKFAEPGPMIQADGKLLWRVMDNLFSNIVKYAQPDSRVYLETTAEKGFGLVILKNMSARPLDVPVESLTDRFVRGDGSRSTEGSGLGLSIVYSLMELQKGRLALTVDGDLFKSEIVIPVGEN